MVMMMIMKMMMITIMLLLMITMTIVGNARAVMMNFKCVSPISGCHYHIRKQF